MVDHVTERLDRCGQCTAHALVRVLLKDPDKGTPLMLVDYCGHHYNVKAIAGTFVTMADVLIDEREWKPEQDPISQALRAMDETASVR